MNRLLISLFALPLAIAAITGCSVSSSPPTAEIDKGVNWALSAYIDWNYRDKNLFDSYKITNQYTEKQNGTTAYVYDFEADCLVRKVLHVGGAGETAAWSQALPNGDKFTSGSIEKFKGTFTLIKKGNTWYRQETIR